MYRKRRFKKRVYYVNSPIFGAPLMDAGAGFAPGGTTVPLVIDLIPNPTQAPSDVQWSGQDVRYGATLQSDIIVDGIHGDCNWSINFAPSGLTAGGGVWGVTVRACIYKGPMSLEEGQTSESPIYDPSAVVYKTGLADISDASSLWSNQTRQPIDGSQMIWAKTWFTSWNPGTTAGCQPYCLNSGQFDPPSNWIASKRKTRLRAQETLYMAYQVSTLNLNGAAGHGQIVVAPSLRIAAHRTRARRT